MLDSQAPFKDLHLPGLDEVDGGKDVQNVTWDRWLWKDTDDRERPE